MQFYRDMDRETLGATYAKEKAHYDACKALVGLLQERLAHTEEVDKLLGALHSALWPETASYATRHDDAIVILFHIHGALDSLSANITFFFDIVPTYSCFFIFL